MRRELFDLFEPPPELVRGDTQRGLGLDVEMTGDVDDREQEIAELVVDSSGVTAADRLAQFCGFLGDLGQRAVDVGPVEADLRGLALHVVRVAQRRL